MNKYANVGTFEVIEERPLTDNSKRTTIQTRKHSPHWKGGEGGVSAEITRWDNGSLSFDIKEWARGGGSKRVMFTLPPEVASIWLKFQETGEIQWPSTGRG